MAATLAGITSFSSAHDLYVRLRRADQAVGLTTIYRCLHDLLDAGAIDLVVSETGEALYRYRVDSDHHHFLVCRSCGHAVEMRSSAIEQWLDSAGYDNGFDRLEHRVEIFGRCPRCRANGDSAAAGPASGHVRRKWVAD